MCDVCATLPVAHAAHPTTGEPLCGQGTLTLSMGQPLPPMVKSCANCHHILLRLN